MNLENKKIIITSDFQNKIINLQNELSKRLMNKILILNFKALFPNLFIFFNFSLNKF